MILVAVFASSQVAMLTAVGFGFIGAVVDEDGTVNHTQSIFSGISLRLPPLTEYKDCNRRVNKYEGTGRAILGMAESGDPSKYIRFASDWRF